MSESSAWLALIVGNTRLHWALVQGADVADATLEATWHTAHFTAQDVQRLMQQRLMQQPFDQVVWPQAWAVHGENGLPQEWWIASVVPQQTALWANCAGVNLVDRDRIPLTNVYPTLGIDRILSLWGAGERYGWPTLVIDAGTALTFTAGIAGQFVGGAIAPGLRLQIQSLAQQTAALPAIDLASDQPLPPRWATSTLEAIQSGILYSVLASIQSFVEDLRSHYPTSAIWLTGGDSVLLHQALAQHEPDLADQIRVDADLMFWGAIAYRAHVTRGRE